jgi:hypothetical protein
MVMYSYRAVMQEDGHVQFKGDVDIPAGSELIITVVGEANRLNEEPEGITIKELRSAPFIGEWADRDDIGDTAEFAEKLRERSQRRSHADD